MRALTIRLVIALAALGLAAGACSNDTCEEAYDKLEACYAAVNCNKLDPLERDKCVKGKNTWDQYSGNKTAYVAACGADSKIQAEADKVASCALDPKTCLCP